MGLGWFVNAYSSHSIHWGRGGGGGGGGLAILFTKPKMSTHKTQRRLVQGIKGVGTRDAR